MQILVANEPRAYREALARAFCKLRPHLAVCEADPGQLSREVIRLQPDLVVCSELPALDYGKPCTWIQLYPEGDSRAVIFSEGRRSTVEEIELSDLLSIIDRALARMNYHSHN